MRLGLFACVLVSGLVACKEEPPAWKATPLASLNDAQKQKLSKAQEAQKALGGKLVEVLSGTIKNQGLQAGIKVCNLKAPEIATGVAQTKGLKIGRTSSKLRNPKNAAPAWMAPIIARGEVKTQVMEGPSGQLGWAAPIVAQDLCVKCHGVEADLKPDVRKALATLYPQDKAVGYKPGDLRGWFWVEVE